MNKILATVAASVCFSLINGAEAQSLKKLKR